MIRAATAISSAIMIAASAGFAQAEPVKLELQLVDHLRAEMIEQDVYVERTAGSGEVYRVTTEDADAFNEMMAKIEYQNSQLKEQHDKLARSTRLESLDDLEESLRIVLGKGDVGFAGVGELPRVLREVARVIAGDTAEAKARRHMVRRLT